MDWTMAQRARRDCFHDASGAEYFAQPRIPEGAVHLIIGEALLNHLADGSLEFFWSGNTSDVGVTRDVGHGQDVYGHSDDGNQ